MPVRRPAYLNAAPLLSIEPPRLDAPDLSDLFHELWARRNEPDQYVRQDPYTGGLIRIAQGLRQVPDAVALSYRLKLGDAADPGVAYQATRAIQGMEDAANMFGLALREDEVRYESERGLWPELEAYATNSSGASVRASQAADGDIADEQLLAVAGRMTNDLSGSLALAVLGDEASLPPPIDLVAEQRVLDFIRGARPLLSAAVPLDRGGLLITLARCCARSELGTQVRLPDAWRELAPVATLFGEAQSRFLLALPREQWPAIEGVARPLEVPLQELGTAGGPQLMVKGAINLDLGRVKAWS